MPNYETKNMTLNGCDISLMQGGDGPPVAFLQGCCGDLNSMKMFVGGVETAERHGRLLGHESRKPDDFSDRELCPDKRLRSPQLWRAPKCSNSLLGE